MAVTSIPQSLSFVLEVKKGEDKNGDPIYANKTFSGLKNGVAPEKVFAVADAIDKVLANETRDCILVSKSALVNE